MIKKTYTEKYTKTDEVGGHIHQCTEIQINDGNVTKDSWDGYATVEDLQDNLSKLLKKQSKMQGEHDKLQLQYDSHMQKFGGELPEITDFIKQVQEALNVIGAHATEQSLLIQMRDSQEQLDYEQSRIDARQQTLRELGIETDIDMATTEQSD